MPLFAAFRWLHVSTLWLYRLVTWVVLACGFLFAIAVFTMRYWILPNAGDYREVIAEQLSVLTHERVSIGRVEG